jgi:hypothetical protein
MSPLTKFIQAILAGIEEHMVGLLGASDSWRMLRRLAPEADGSHPFYNLNGSIKSNVHAHFEDWVSDSDFLDRKLRAILFLPSASMWV